MARIELFGHSEHVLNPSEPEKMGERLAGRATAAENLVTSLDDLLAPYLRLTWEEGTRDMRRFVTVVSIRRQSEAVRATALLAQNGLGHLAPVFLRPACDEYLWLTYVATLEPAVANIILFQLSAYESNRAVIAQQQYTGKRAMGTLGFPASFVKSVFSLKPNAESRLQALARRLDWPTDKGGRRIVPPPTAWIASVTSNGKLYDFLYSATSRSVHFSPSEVARRGWSNEYGEGDEHELDLMSPIYYHYRTAFALYWSCHLLIRTTGHAFKLIDRESPESEDMGDAGDRYTAAIEEVVSFGKVPAVIPEEFNIRRANPGVGREA